ncbi:MAG: hypothetical protein A2Y38_07220 [Spirochaetes bacterium GWB1_59_5]|nr:MAG: hypothetical protein A2Y38_07220 [Spirochaetes bacterium GWB1_59_5]
MDVLAKKKPQVRARYLERVQQPVVLPPTLVVPDDPRAALVMGLKLGRSSGYGDGLVDGAELGLDVVLEVMDAMMNFPVFAFGGSADGQPS